MSPELIAAIFTGLTALIAALSTFTANRSRRVETDQKGLKRRVRKLERQVVALVQHTFTLELEIARTGGHIPERPILLEMLDHDGNPDDSNSR